MIRFNRRNLLLVLAVLVLLIGLAVYTIKEFKSDLTWTMVNVNHTSLQGDAHLIQVEDGKIILIDAGYLKPAREKLVPLLGIRKIGKIDIAFITHPHRDHYEGLIPILNAGIKINTVFFNIPDKALCDREVPWGCNYQQVLAYHKVLNQKGVRVKSAKVGMQFDLGSGTLMKILYVFDGINTPVGMTDINDLSLIMMLEQSGRKILFAGDLNRKLGTYLANNVDDLQADILKVPHHGVKGIAPNSFFQKVNPKFALVPAPEALWCSTRGKQARNWFADKQIPVYVNGAHGHIEVKFYGERIEIIPEIAKSAVCE
jgi:competence protein ComEC